MNAQLDMVTILLGVLAVAVSIGAIGIWALIAVLRSGLNEHIKAMQAIYENTRKMNSR